MASRSSYNKLVAGILLLSVILVAVVLVRARQHQDGLPSATTSASTQSSGILDALDATQVMQQTLDANSATSIVGFSGIVPHHVPPAGELVARVAATLRNATPDTIVIVGPDHPDHGTTLFTTTLSSWQGAGHRYSTNTAVVQKLLRLQTVRTNDELIRNEHSVLIPAPFFAERFPHARFVFLTVRSNFEYAEIQELTKALTSVLGLHDLVIASSDFSHYKPLAEAQRDDEISIPLLQIVDPEILKDIPADSAGSLAVAMGYAKARGARAFSLLDHSNSALLLKDPALPSTTSYVTGVWK